MRLLDSLLILLGLLLLLGGLSLVVLSLVWIERKFLGRVHRRMGPMRTGFHGLLQPVADAVKLLVKEDLLPTMANRAVFWVAPLVVMVPSFMIWVTIPAARNLVIRNLDLGLFYIVAFSVLTIVGLLMAGWGSANKYATLGGLRSAAQLLSYEIPVIMAVLGVAMLAQSLSLVEIADAQVPGGQSWERSPNVVFALLQPLGLFIFIAAGLAEVGRTPFDIYTAESEVVGGPFVEYSGAHWAVFFLAEYMNTFAIGALTALLFLGGWHGPLLPPWLWFLIKTYFVVMFIFWIRGTFPRLRIDQLMSFGWKGLIPLSFVNIVITGIYLFYGWPAWSLTLMSLAVLAVTFYIIYRQLTAPVMRVAAQAYSPRGGS